MADISWSDCLAELLSSQTQISILAFVLVRTSSGLSENCARGGGVEFVSVCIRMCASTFGCLLVVETDSDTSKRNLAPAWFYPAVVQ